MSRYIASARRTARHRLALASWFAAAALLAAAPASAQRVGDDVPWVNKDYFRAGEEADNKALLGNVERNHMGVNNFYKSWGKADYPGAIGDLLYTLWVFPNHPKALYYLGRLAITSKQPALPIPHFRKAIEKFPEHAYTYAQFGAYLSDIGQLPAAVEKLKQAIAMDPSLAPAYAWLAVAYGRLGETGLAGEAASRARELGFTGPIDSALQAPSAAPAPSAGRDRDH